MTKLVMLPGPTNVPTRVMNAMVKPIINHRSDAFRELHASIKEKAQKVFETSGDIVVLTASGTGGVEAAIENLVRSGDNVVVPVFGEFGSRVADSVVQAGGNAVRVEAPFGDAPRIDKVEEAFEDAKDVKAVIVVYNETSTGVTYRWLKELGETASRYGAFYVVDAISILGGDELPVDALGADICITGTQKCIAAPPGLAILSISQRAKKYMTDNPPKSLFFNLPRFFRYAEIGETPFTPALPLFYALEEALMMMLEEGLPTRFKRHRVCAEAFYSAFEAMGLKPFADREVRSNTVIAVRYPEGVDDRQFRSTLDKKFNILVAGGFGAFKGKLFRVGSMGIVDQFHVLTTVAAISAALNLQGFKNDSGRAINVAIEKLKELE